MAVLVRLEYSLGYTMFVVLMMYNRCYGGMFREFRAVNVRDSVSSLFGEELSIFKSESYLSCVKHCVENPMCSSGRLWTTNATCILYAPPGNVQETTQAHVLGSEAFLLDYVSCPTCMGYVHDEKSGLCIKMVTSSPTTWEQAAQSCAEDRAQLVKIDSQLEQDCIESLIFAGERIRSYYIGLNDHGSEGNVVWTDGTQMKYDHFLPKALNGDRGENCVIVRKSDQYWGDWSCSTKFAYICEVRYV